MASKMEDQVLLTHAHSPRLAPVYSQVWQCECYSNTVFSQQNTMKAEVNKNIVLYSFIYRERSP